MALRAPRAIPGPAPGVLCHGVLELLTGNRSKLLPTSGLLLGDTKGSKRLELRISDTEFPWIDSGLIGVALSALRHLLQELTCFPRRPRRRSVP
jgi:hypothetical protein